MECTQDPIHDRLSFATLKHVAGLLDAELIRAGVDTEAKRQSVCGSFLFHAAYFLDNQWVELGGRRFRVGLCFQEVGEDDDAPAKTIVTDYEDGEVLHEAALGISEAHFTGESVVPSFNEVGEVYEAG